MTLSLLRLTVMLPFWLQTHCSISPKLWLLQNVNLYVQYQIRVDWNSTFLLVSHHKWSGNITSCIISKYISFIGGVEAHSTHFPHIFRMLLFLTFSWDTGDCCPESAPEDMGEMSEDVLSSDLSLFPGHTEKVAQHQGSCYELTWKSHCIVS